MTDTTGKGPLEARLLLGLGMLLFSIGQSLTFAIVAPMARQVGFAPQAFGIALTLASLPLVFSAPFWGRRSDVVGRKPVFIVGITGAALGTLLVALVLELGLRGTVTGMGLLVLFALARGSSGVAASAIYPASSAYIVDITDVRHRGQGLAIIGAANGMGSVLGPVMAGALAMFGPLVPMYVASAIGLAGAILAWRLLPVPPRHANPGKKVAMKITDPRLRPYIIMWFCFFLTFMALQLILGFYLQDEYGVTDPRDLVRQVSLMLISMAAMIVVVQIGVFQLIRIRPQILLRVLGPFFVLALAIIGLAPNLVVMATGFGVLGIAFA
ncbi:MAG: MFS transporter, partial [Gammaproteobacteria bacterium]|nr:MFS transporter [Gammaproteobacteria bacterium]